MGAFCCIVTLSQARTIRLISDHLFRTMGSRKRAPVAQLDRASDFESAGRPFESGRARQIFSIPLAPWFKPTWF